jgi:oligosaccharyltransferase complex subunit gamma
LFFLGVTKIFCSGWKPQPLAEELSKATPVPIPYSTPFAWDRWATIGAGVIALGVALRLGNGITILLSIWPWAISTIFLSLVMTSGYMFTRIRESPWMGRDGGWVAPAPQNQFGREVQMVFAICACIHLLSPIIIPDSFGPDGTLAFSFVMLIMVVPRQRSALVQRVQVYGLTATIVIVYSVLIVFYKVKMRGKTTVSSAKPHSRVPPGYPFRLLL